MKIADLLPTFPEPPIPEPVGPDADFFRACARYKETERVELDLLDRLEYVRTPKGAAELETAEKAHGTAREALMMHRAHTLAGVKLKLELLLSDWTWNTEDDPGDEIALTWGAIRDLKEMMAGREEATIAELGRKWAELQDCWTTLELRARELDKAGRQTESEDVKAEMERLLGAADAVRQRMQGLPVRNFADVAALLDVVLELDSVPEKCLDDRPTLTHLIKQLARLAPTVEIGALRRMEMLRG